MNSSADSVKAKYVICVVDDDEMFRDILCEILVAQKFEVIVFDSASDFLESDLVVKKSYDLIITDINMPGVSGYDLCKKIRSQFSRGRTQQLLHGSR